MVEIFKEKGRFVIIGLVLVLVGGWLVNSLLTSSQANQTPTEPTSSVTVTNDVPTVDIIGLSEVDDNGTTVNSFIPNGTVTPPSGAEVVNLVLAGEVSDLNGLADYGDNTGTGTNGNTSVRAVFYRTGVDPNGVTINANCTPDKNYCYQVECALTDSTDATKLNTRDYECSFALASWADSTVASSNRYPADAWLGEVIVTDNVGQTATDTISVEVGSLVSVDVPAEILYGQLSLGGKTDHTNNYAFILTQKGNDQADVSVSGTPMSCSSGTIPVDKQLWSLEDVGYDTAVGTALSGTERATNLNLPYRDSEDDGGDYGKNLYWDLEVPATGVTGYCSGTNTITISSADFETGQLAGSVLAGVSYEVKTSATSGSTDVWTGETDANGYFNYKDAGDVVTFLIGDVEYGTFDTNNLNHADRGDVKVYPQDIVQIPRDSTGNLQVRQMMRFVQSVDDDADDTNGFQITSDVKESLRDLGNTTLGLTSTIVDATTGRVKLDGVGPQESDMTALVVTKASKVLKSDVAVGTYLTTARDERKTGLDGSDARDQRQANNLVAVTSVSAPVGGVSSNDSLPDDPKPVITLNGDNPHYWLIGTTYVDSGATVTDDQDTGLLEAIVDYGLLDTATAGSYDVTYSFTDLHTNAAIPVTRTVHVQDAWKIYVSNLSSRSDMGTVSIGSKIYVFGGRNNVTSYLSNMKVLDANNGDTWVFIDGGVPNYLTARSNMGMTALDGKIYIFGGYDGSNYLNDMYVYDPQEFIDNRWEKLPAVHSDLTPRSHIGMAATNGKVYILGGYDGSRKSDMYSYDVSDGSWINMNRHASISAREGMGMTAADGKVYIFGGIKANGNTLEYKSDLYIYDSMMTATSWADRWTKKIVSDNFDLNNGRTGVGLTVVGNKVYIFGGNQGGKNWKDMYSYDTINDNWAEVSGLPDDTELPYNRNMGMTSVDGKIYIYGGYNDANYYFKTHIYLPAP